MKTFKYMFLLLLSAVVFHACSSTGTTRGATSSIDGLDISARAAVGRLEALGPLYIGDGGANITLAVLIPEVHGEVPAFLPLFIQGMLNNNINRFSAINIIDRQNLNRIVSEQNLALSGIFSDDDFIRIGNITNAHYLLMGSIQRLSGNRFSLQFSISETSTGIRRATFMREGTLSQIEGQGTILNEATAELLVQLGIQFTETGRQTLLAGNLAENISAVQAEVGFARGITAQAGGNEVAALFNFAQAVSFDPTQLEAVSWLETLSTSISGGTISQQILNDIQLRDQWLAVFNDTVRFFNDHPPFQIVFDPSLTQIGETDFRRRTVNLGMHIALDPSEAGFDVLNSLLEGLENTGRRQAWGFSGWPLQDISPRTRGTVVFNDRNSFRYRVDVALLNDHNQTIATSRITLNADNIRFHSGDTMVIPPSSVEEIVQFSNIRVDDLTPALTIVILAVNGIPTRDLGGSMRIEPVNWEARKLAQRSSMWGLGQILDQFKRISNRVEIYKCLTDPMGILNYTFYANSNGVQSLFNQIEVLFRNNAGYELLMGSHSKFLESDDRDWKLSSASGRQNQSDHKITVRINMWGAFPFLIDVIMHNNRGAFVREMFIREVLEELEGHPIIGTWILENTEDGPRDASVLSLEFSHDGRAVVIHHDSSESNVFWNFRFRNRLTIGFATYSIQLSENNTLLTFYYDDGSRGMYRRKR